MREIRTTVMGNVTGDVAETTHPDGNSTARFRIAVNSRFFNGEKREFADRKTEFINVYARRALARHVLASVGKGQPLVVHGRLSTQEWTGDDGVTRFALSITADAIGHDLTYGTSAFTKAAKPGAVPNVDWDTGAMLEERDSGEEMNDDIDVEADEAGEDTEHALTAVA